MRHLIGIVTEKENLYSVFGYMVLLKLITGDT